MFTHTHRAPAFAAIVLGIAAAVSMHAAGAEINRTQYLTFSQPVALPGVTLPSGTYLFELPVPEVTHDIVRVMSRDRKTVYFTAFTRAVDRPSGVPLAELVSLREAAPGQPAPIAVWWSDSRTGRRFIYP